MNCQHIFKNGTQCLNPKYNKYDLCSIHFNKIKYQKFFFIKCGINKHIDNFIIDKSASFNIGLKNKYNEHETYVHNIFNGNKDIILNNFPKFSNINEFLYYVSIYENELDNNNNIISLNSKRQNILNGNIKKSNKDPLFYLFYDINGKELRLDEQNFKYILCEIIHQLIKKYNNYQYIKNLFEPNQVTIYVNGKLADLDKLYFESFPEKYFVLSCMLKKHFPWHKYPINNILISI